MNRYGKLVDNKIVYHNAKNPIILEDGRKIVSTDPQVLLEHGLKLIVFSLPAAPLGYVANGYEWVEEEKQIVQTWDYVEYIEPEEEPSVEERLEAVEAAMLELIELMYGGDM